jgi:ATP-dependent helicase/nuclease subunit B
MLSIIDRIVHTIAEENIPLENLTIVLPSRRAAKYLQRSLYSYYKKPIFSPEIVTIDQWVKSCSNRTVIDSSRLLFELYPIHCAGEHSSDKGIDEFLKWGRTLLSDFDEIDRYLVKSKDLFRNLADIKELENWAFDTHTPSPAQQRFMEFWDALPGYYEEFNKRLSDKKLAYLGSIYKEVAENIDLVFKPKPSQHFIFAGFNALSPTELSIMKQLKNMGRAHILFEADKFFLDNPLHEAGKFIKKNCEELGIKPSDFVTNNILEAKKDFTIINCTQPTGQAKVAGHILAEEIPVSEYSETLLLLGDEQLIVPVLKNIPLKVGKANITLGLPLKATALRSWNDILFRIQESYQHIRPGTIYHKDFIRIIKHPFVQGIMTDEDSAYASHIEGEILRKNWVLVYTSKLDFSETIKQLIACITQKWTEDYLAAIKIIRKSNAIIHQEIDEERYALERSAIYHFDSAIAKLEQILFEYQPKLLLKTFKNLFQQHWTSVSIAYYGNPLDGLQVMGLLETRLLNFKNIIAVGMNDGSMPPTNPIQTFIPMDLRKFHQLPLTSDKQALFAHHFYRLLPAAEKCWFTYSSANSLKGVDEQSRYLRQLKFELTGASKMVGWNEVYYTIDSSRQDNQEIFVKKDEIIQSRLDAYFERGTSASALMKFMNCSLDFYYRYLIGLGEEDIVEEEIEASTLGSFIHGTLEELYEPFAEFDKKFNKKPSFVGPLRPSALDKMLKTFTPILSTLFKNHFDNNEEFVSSGKNYLSHEIALHLTERFLQKEKHEIEVLEQQVESDDQQLWIQVLEGEIRREFEVEVDGEKKKIALRGFIDRIDKINGEVRILDYKTGKCEQADVTITSKSKSSELSDIEHLLKLFQTRKFVFQLLTYNFLYKGIFPNKPYSEKIGIISLNNLNDSPFFLENKLTSSMDELMDLYEQALGLLIQRIYSTENKFEHNPQAKYCDYC